MKRYAFVTAVLAAVTIAMPAQARIVPIDVNSFEQLGDADDGDSVALPFVVNAGSGATSDVTVRLTDAPNGGVPGTSDVGLNLSGGDSLFANVFINAIDSTHVVLLSNSTVLPGAPHAIGPSSVFAFGNMIAPIVPPGPGTYYGPFSGLAMFQFIDLSGTTGNVGDFELLLTCNEICADIGFNLGGLAFSANTFDPNNAPSQLQSSDVTRTESGFITSSTFDFRFTSENAVPEPGTWLSMLLGFAVLGAMLRRDRKAALA